MHRKAPSPCPVQDPDSLSTLKSQNDLGKAVKVLCVVLICLNSRSSGKVKSILVVTFSLPKYSWHFVFATVGIVL